MKKLTAIVLLQFIVLTACGKPVDDPDTVPVAGKWIGNGKLMALSVNGVAMDISNTAQFNEMLSKIDQVNEICGEPKNMSESEFQEKLGGSGKFADCTIDSTETRGNRIIETASCRAVDMPGVTDRVRLTGNTSLEPEKVISDLTMSMTLRKPTGEGAVVKLEMRGTMNRVGDC